MEIHAEEFCRAPPQQVWDVITDYERLPAFVPNLTSSAIVAREESALVLEQHGSGGLPLVSHDIHLLLRVTERPLTAIDMIRLAGNMQRYDAHWTLCPAHQDGCDGTRIAYRASLQADFFIPPLAGPALAQAGAERMLRAVREEVERRERRTNGDQAASAP